MKRFFTLFTTVLFILCAHAQIAFIQLEDTYSSEADGGQCPELTAYNWFNENYVTNHTLGTGSFIKLSDFSDADLSGYSVIWLAIGRSLDNKEALLDLVDETDRNKLKAYIEAGGNVFLSGHASYLSHSIGRVTEDLNTCGWNSAYVTGTDDWSVRINSSGHKIWSAFDAKDVTPGSRQEGAWYEYKLVGHHRNDRNCLWTGKNWSDFQNSQNCKIHGFWGNDGDPNGAGLVEFYPKGDFKGTIIVDGLAAYQWGKDNTYLNHVKYLTQGILDYLSQRVTASWTTSPKANPIIKEEEDVAITMSEHCSVSFTSSDVTKAEINAEGHISYNHFGEVTIKAVVTGDGENIPKNKFELSEIRTVTGGTIASYAYALPFSFYTMNNYAGDDGTWKPDYQAAKWFYDNYVVTGKGCFINPTNYSSSTPIPTTIKVLWVNNDRVGQESDALKTAFGGNDFVNALSAFVVSGGNVFLSKQATRFIGDIGRAQRWPSYGVSTEGPADGPWYMVDNFVAVTIGTPGGGGVSLHDHPVYATLRATKSNQYTEHIWTDDKSVVHNEGPSKWPLFDGEGNRTKMTYIWGEPTTVWSESYGMSSGTRTTEYATVTSFENNDGMKCKILGGWGHTTALDAVGFVEFPPETIGEKTFDGSVICIGLPAYQWSVGNTYIANVRALTQGILDYLGGVVVVTEPETDLTNTTVDDLVVYQGGSVSNTEDITIKNSITYIRPAVGGTAENELGHWYTFCLPFTPSSVKVLDEEDGFDYAINSVYLTGSEADTSEPSGAGSFYLQTFDNYDGEEAHWAYIGNYGMPTKDRPYIIKFLDDSENSDLADYFTSNPTVKFVGGAQTIDGTDGGTGGTPNGDYSYHVNHTLQKLTMRHVYPLNTATNMFEYDYGGPSEIMPFECYIKASTPALAAARPRFAIGRGAQQGTEITTAVETVAAPLQPLLIYDVTGRLCYEGMPQTLPSGIWIVRQGEKSRTIVVP